MARFVRLLMVFMLLVSALPAVAQGGPGTRDFYVRDFGVCINLPDFTRVTQPDRFNTVYEVPGLFSINFAEYLLPLETLPATSDEIYQAMIALLDTVNAGEYTRVDFSHPQLLSAAVEFTLDGRRMFGMIYRNQDDRLFFLFADKVEGFDMLAIGRAIFPANRRCTPIAVAGVTGPAGQGDRATVTRVIDGDTIEVNLGGTLYRVRYIGINTPEAGEVCGAEATAANAALVRGQTVTLVRDVSETDQYGRLLRYVYVGDTFVNAELARQGFAEAVQYPPDTAHAAEFAALADQARASGLGCWPTGVFGGQPQAPQAPAAVCDCASNIYNCADFSTQAAAQGCYAYCLSTRGFDVHRLDRDNDGVACESLP